MLEGRRIKYIMKKSEVLACIGKKHHTINIQKNSIGKTSSSDLFDLFLGTENAAEGHADQTLSLPAALVYGIAEQWTYKTDFVLSTSDIRDKSDLWGFYDELT